MQFVEPDNCGTIFVPRDRWSKWVHRFAILPVGNDIKSHPLLISPKAQCYTATAGRTNMLLLRTSEVSILWVR